MNLATDNEKTYYLDTKFIQKNKKPLFFGAVTSKKNYVSFHLMPVYVEPKLLNGISDGLKKRMQGKSCFNFQAVDEGLFEELKTLAEKGYQFYKKEGYLET